MLASLCRMLTRAEEFMIYLLGSTKKNIKRAVSSCSICLFVAINASATSLAAYQSSEGGTLLFYADGNSGFASYEYEGWYPSSEVKFCSHSSAWHCVVGSLSFAYPKDASVKNWCFAGSQFSKDPKRSNDTNEKVHVLASNRYKFNGKDIDETNRFVFDNQRGLISFYSADNTHFSLISRTGVLGEEFVRDMSSFVTEEELSYLIGKCNNPPNSHEIDKKIFGKEPTID